MKAAQKAYESVKRGIIDGRYPPGGRITESEIAEAAEVSRTPVREALRRLEAEGLIRFVPNQGAFVSNWDQTDVDGTFELRSLLEGYAARLCAERATPEQVAELMNLAQRQAKIVAANADGLLEQVADLNARFHRLIQEGAASEQLKATLGVLSNAPLVFQTLRDYAPEDLARSAKHHLEIAEAVGAGDGAWAESVMRTHIIAARRIFRARHEESNS